MNISIDIVFIISLYSVRLEQGTVTSLIEEKGIIKGVRYKTKDGQEITAYAPLTIVCDGCFSNLRRSLCDPKVEIYDCQNIKVMRTWENVYNFNL